MDRWTHKSVLAWEPDLTRRPDPTRPILFSLPKVLISFFSFFFFHLILTSSPNQINIVVQRG